MKNKLESVIDKIVAFVPRDILALIIDDDILLLTAKGLYIDDICQGLNVDRDYVVSTNNRWYGFDGWTKENAKSEYTINFVLTRYQELAERVEKFYERN